jgi:molybdenum cofactor synthesis domain-containing protein
MATAAILTIGNELVSGDVPNTNGSWLAKRLAPLGVETRLLASVPDEIEPIAELIRREAPLVDFFIVTGGLGGTPDDLTREALAHTFNAPQEERPDLAAELRARFVGDPEYAVRWAALPRGARARSRILSVAHPASRSRMSMCCPASRPRWRRCSIRSPRSSVAAVQSARGAARIAPARA